MYRWRQVNRIILTCLTSLICPTSLTCLTCLTCPKARKNQKPRNRQTPLKALAIFSPLHLFIFRSYGVKELSQMYRWLQPFFHLFTLSPLKGAAIFSPFHPFTFSPLKGAAIFSPFHFFTFISLFTFISPFHYAHSIRQSRHHPSWFAMALQRNET